MYWHNAPGANIRTDHHDAWLVDACENSIGPEWRIGDDDPQIRLVEHLTRVEWPGGTWRDPYLVLVGTRSQLVAAQKKGALGKRAQTSAWHLPDWLTLGLGSRGSGLYVCQFENEVRQTLSFVFDTAEAAKRLAEWARTA